MKEILTEASEKQQFLTFLIKKDRDGKNGLWFVLIFLPSLGNFTIRDSVWRKIEANGLPKDLGTHGPFTLGGKIQLLGGDDASPDEKKYIELVRARGSVGFSIPCGTDAFSTREELFGFLLDIDEGLNKNSW